MAFPVVEATAETAVATASTTHAISLPAFTGGSSANDVGQLLTIETARGSAVATFNALAGWNELVDDGLANGVTVWWREIDGTEGATATFTSSASTRSASIARRISGAADPSTLPPQISAVATGSSVNPNASNLVPTGGAKDYLWLTMFARSGEEADDDTWTTAAPSGFTGLLQKACGVAGTNLGGMVASAQQNLNAASLDAGSFTVATGGWRAHTIAIHPDPRHFRTLTAATETDAPIALVFTKPIHKTLTASTETDSAQALVVIKPINVALTAATETDAALTMTRDAPSQNVGITPATETDAAQALAFTKSIRKTLTPAAETNTAQTASFTKPIRKTFTPASETDAANALAFTKPIRVSLTAAAELDVAQTMNREGVAQNKALTPAIETDSAQGLAFIKPIRRAVSPAVTTDVAVALAVTKRAVLMAAGETDSAVALVFSGGAIAGHMEPVSGSTGVDSGRSSGGGVEGPGSVSGLDEPQSGGSGGG